MGCGASKVVTAVPPLPASPGAAANAVNSSPPSPTKFDLNAGDKYVKLIDAVQDELPKLAEGLTNCIGSIEQKLEGWGWTKGVLGSVLDVLPQIEGVLTTVSNVIIPPPGGAVVGAVIQIAHMVVRDKMNNQACVKLAEECTALLQPLLNPSVQENLKRTGDLQQCVQAFFALAQDIRDFVDDCVVKKNWFSRLMSWSDTAIKLSDYEKQLVNMHRRLSFNVQVQTFDIVASAEREKKSLDEKIQAKLKEKGGDTDKLMEDTEALKEIAQGMSGADMVLALHLQALRKGQAQAESSGPHSLVRHPTMRKLWYDALKTEKVDWSTFWLAFPSRVSQPDLKEKLTQLLATEADKKLFQMAVDKEDVKTVSVAEINLAFPSEEEEMLTKHVTELKDYITAGKAAYCGLPKLPTGFVGRDEEVDKLAGIIEGSQAAAASTSAEPPSSPPEPCGPRVVVVSGAPGEGKRSVAAAAAEKLRQRFTGGVFFCTLGTVVSSHDLEQSLIEGLTPVVKQGAVLSARLMEIATVKLPALFLIDSVEEVVASEQLKNKLSELVARCLDMVPKMHIVMTSRVEVELGDDVPVPTSFALAPLKVADAVKILQDGCPGVEMSQRDAEKIAEKQGCNPQLIKTMAGYLKDEIATVTEALEMDIGDMMDTGNKQAARMKSSFLKHLNLLHPDLLGSLMLLCATFAGAFTQDGAQTILGAKTSKECVKVKNNLNTLLNSSLLIKATGSYSGVTANVQSYMPVPMTRDLVRHVLVDPSACEEVKVREQAEKALAKLPAAREQLVPICAAQLKTTYELYFSSPQATFDMAAKSKASIEQALSLVKDPSFGAELARKPDVKAAYLSLLRHMVYLAAAFDQAAVQDVCLALADAYAGDVVAEGTARAVHALFFADNSTSWGQSLEQAELALALLEGRTDTDSALVRVMALRAKGLILRAMYQRLEDAIKAHEDALDILKTLQASKQEKLQVELERVINMGELSGTLDYKAMYGRGKEIGGQAVVAAKALFKDANHPVMAMCLASQAYNVKGLEDYEAALEQHTKAFDIRTFVLGASHMETALSLNQMAICEQGMQKYDEAEQHFEESKRIRIACLGDVSTLVANTWEGLAKLHVEMHNVRGEETYREAAIKEYTRVVEIRKELMGVGNGKVTTAAEALIGLLKAAGREEEAGQVASQYLPAA